MEIGSFDVLFPLFVLGELASHRTLEEGEIVLYEGLAVAQSWVMEIYLRIDALTFSGSHYYYTLQYAF